MSDLRFLITGATGATGGAAAAQLLEQGRQQVSARGDATSHSARDHWRAERIFDWSDLNVDHIRPTYFAEWLLYLAPMIRQGVMYAPFTTGRNKPIAGEDQGRVIVGILENPEPHRGNVYRLYGPVEMTHDEIAPDRRTGPRPGNQVSINAH